MQVSAYPISHASALEALRTAEENLKFVYNVYPELDDRSVPEAIHCIAGARRRVFESYLRDTETSSGKGARG